MASKASGFRSDFASLKAVQEAMFHKLEASGLDRKDAKYLHYDAFHASTVAAQLGVLPAVASGFRIPYFDMEGRRTKFWRFRYLETTKHGFDALTDKKPLKYAQPPKTVNELYLPPLGDVEWKTLAADPNIPLIITEGELKAACATKFGFPTIGLGGVWCFKSNSARQPVLSQFKEFNWKGRAVYIAYDSDAISNHMVMQAENALARELMLMGAEPYVVRIPAGSSDKVGLDDFIIQMGRDAMGELLHDAKEWRAAQELFKMNEEVVYVRDPGIILRLDTYQRITAQAFTQHAYSTRIYYEEQATQNGTKMVERSAAKEWLKWPARGEVQRVGYVPGVSGVTDKGEFSVWRGWGVTPVKGDIKPWNDLLDFLFSSEPQHRKWFEQWCAYPLQHPGTKLYSCCLFWGGKHGTGKSLIGYTIGRIYGTNFTEIKSKNLHDTHNEWAENKQFVMGDEISANDKRGVSDHMKGIITQLKLRLNPKYVPSYEVMDCINYFFTSNHPNAFFLEDDDRRNFIIEVLGSPMAREFYMTYDKWLKGDGPSHLFHHLLSLDLTGFDPMGHAPDTNAKREMTEGGRSDLASWVHALKESPETILRMDNVVIKRDLWRSEDLLRIYDPDMRGKVTSNGLARELKVAGFQKLNKGMGVYTADGQVRLWAVRNAARYLAMSGADLAKCYEKERGLKSASAADEKPVKPKKAKF